MSYDRSARELQVLHGSDASFFSHLRTGRKRSFCAKLPTLTNFAHGLFGIITAAPGGTLIFLGAQALKHGSTAVAIGIATLSPPVALALGITLMIMGVTLLGLLVRDLCHKHCRKSLHSL